MFSWHRKLEFGAGKDVDRVPIRTGKAKWACPLLSPIAAYCSTISVLCSEFVIDWNISPCETVTVRVRWWAMLADCFLGYFRCEAAFVFCPKRPGEHLNPVFKDWDGCVRSSTPCILVLPMWSELVVWSCHWRLCEIKKEIKEEQAVSAVSEG